ncbi:hypothetical protein GGD63_002740 [Bradyrhizobium sp. cir1]|uniref:hypothetical protein n=1 Tax=Bradyrhizobium sp. cir1 TaxID=1445730 RepID=UPI00160692D3|nr:hypothetical protein [Bradyrhizobium sp. cir1]MBB4369947.1 hypothetical protein [Bradyrhizobium sp. cir1]
MAGTFTRRFSRDNVSSEQNNFIGEARDASVTTRKISQPPKRRVIQSEQALIVLAADFNKAAALQIVQLGLEFGQRKIAAHDLPLLVQGTMKPKVQ